MSPAAPSLASSAVDSAARTYVGVDENGLGPRLGPLIVTAVSARATGDAAPILTKRPRGSLAARLGDSKRLVSFDDSALGEAWARAILGPAAATLGTPAELVRALCLDEDAVLRAACPSHHEHQCWGAEGESFAADASAVGAIARDLARLAGRGVQVTRVRVAVLCAKKLNEGVARGRSRFDEDLHAMERLVIDAAGAEGAGGDVTATCGKVGGFDKYGGAFGRFMLHTPLVEGRARSEYRVPGVGTVAFVRDAEERNPLVAMASLVGKWVRDLLMRRIVRFHRAHVPDAPDASGYHDPVTTRFIQATALTRKAARVDDECFVRRALPTEASAKEASAKEAGPTSKARARETPRANP